jgi:hypothetical protein
MPRTEGQEAKNQVPRTGIKAKKSLYPRKRRHCQRPLLRFQRQSRLYTDQEGGQEHINVDQTTSRRHDNADKEVVALNGMTMPRKKVVDEQGTQEDGVRGRCPFFRQQCPLSKPWHKICNNEQFANEL